MHGPVRGKDGAYYFALNLAHDGSGAAYMGGGNVMGTYGGFDGWAFRVEPNGRGGPFAHGLRSPASLGAGPDGRLWYADNQGDFVATSKLFELKQDKFYGGGPETTPLGGNYVYDITDLNNPKLLAPIIANASLQSGGHTFVATPDGRYGMTIMTSPAGATGSWALPTTCRRSCGPPSQRTSSAPWVRHISIHG